MQIGVIGLGRMGGNIARRLMGAGHRCVVYDRAPDAVAGLVGEGATAAANLDDLVANLAAPRCVANAACRKGRRRYGRSAATQACRRPGGKKAAIDRIDPILAALAPGRGSITTTPMRENRDDLDARAEQGYLHCGPAGSGHFVKMIHNGIEYALMQAYAEGFDILRNKESEALPQAERYDLNLTDIAEVWRRGSVISSWLLDLTSIALAEDGALSNFSGSVADSGEGRWTLDAAIEEAVPVDVLAASLFARFRSRQEHRFGDKLLSAMRHQFGGHVETRPAP